MKNYLSRYLLISNNILVYKAYYGVMQKIACWQSLYVEAYKKSSFVQLRILCWEAVVWNGSKVFMTLSRESFSLP
ncbi:hypothetical protein GCM10008107_08040 [Psychrosphaera saromensis]|jgi:hypothetical protein|nr:hypothetical protein GCM10008107_08040 [Psychrosphaera saromensis]GLQ15307.1 hypothetical protein GCM10007917_27620 [Psychrosphaera saromensis]